MMVRQSLSLMLPFVENGKEKGVEFPATAENWTPELLRLAARKDKARTARIYAAGFFFAIVTVSLFAFFN